MRASLNLSGQAGLIDMPSGEQLPDAFLTFNHSQFGPIVRNAMRFQITPRLSGTFRYIGIHDWNAKSACLPHCLGVDKYPIYYDRNFDLSYQILTEGRYLPALTIGLQDFVGTGLSSAEYVAATKTFGSRLRVTAGIGFGRLGSYNPLGQPFGPRAKINIGQGGNLNSKQWFHGDAAPFGGIEYQLNDKVTLKAEYSSDAYTEETTKRGTFNHKSPMNFGVEYQPNDSIRLGGYYMYGSEFGVNITYYMNVAQRPGGGIAGPGPEPVKVRPTRQADPATWSTGWTEVTEAQDILFGTLRANLANTGIIVESLGFTATRAQVRFRNTKYDAAAQAVGRVARAMSQAMPASVEIFELVPVDHGIASSKVVIRRSDLETFEFAPRAGTELRVRSDLVDAGDPLPGTKQNPEVYPRFTWSVLPFAQSLLFSPANPLQLGVGLRFAGKYEVSPGFILSGSITDLLVSNISDKKIYTGPGPYVRSDAVHYYTHARPDLQTLTAAWYNRIAPAVYSRVTIGYLEEMFGGVSTEVLWHPVNSPWALGAEANYVAQRNTDGGFGFNQYNYRVATGHVSGYYDFGGGFHGQLDVGRYLRGDVGATLSLTREFENGWRIGAFATKTNLSAADFGEGSFDKGITLQIPVSWLTNMPTRTMRPVTLRPVLRDGGARLDVTDRLYEVVRSYDETRMDAQWGRIWK
ncbi:YjbH domain-containing protein [bacterium]|nr:YjbH domain-containing protein [bacterium]